MSPKALSAVAAGFCLSALGLLTLGFIMLTSTSSGATYRGDPFYFAKRQAIWMAVGLAACAATALVDYRRYRKWAWPMLIVAMILLVAVLFFGKRINGATRWFVLGPVRFQPSEFAKYALVVMLAFWLEKMSFARKGRARPRIQHWGWGVYAPVAIAGLMAALVVKEPDLGTGLLLCTVAVLLVWLSGASWAGLATIVVPAAMTVGAGLVAIFRYGMFYEFYQVRRLMHWWLQDDLQGTNFQQHMASVALGSGGLWGLGLGNSRMKFGSLPEAHTDFILPIIGEELGLAGTLAVLLAFAVLILCGFLLAGRAPDLFGRLLVSGIVSVIGLQAVINIAVVTNTLPNKGMALPFISYGGSNLCMTLAATGVVLNVFWRAHVQARCSLRNL